MPVLKERVWSEDHRVWLCPGTTVEILRWEENGDALIRVGANLETHISHDQAQHLLEAC